MAYRLKTIYRKIDYWTTKLLEFQETCPHIVVTMEYKSNTGNYDPSADCYWRDYHCHDCDKRWSKDGHRD